MRKKTVVGALLGTTLGFLGGYYFSGFVPAGSREEVMGAPSRSEKPATQVPLAAAPLPPGNQEITVDYAASLEEIFRMERREDRSMPLIKLFSKLGDGDVEQVLALLQTIENDTHYEEALLPFLIYFTGIDADAACALAASHEGQLGERAVKVAIHFRARTDPEGAWNWLESARIDPSEMAAGRRSLVEIWTDDHLEEATNFYLNLPAHEIFDSDLVVLTARHLEKGGPETALNWLGRLEERNSSASSVARVALVRLWATDAPEKVVAWLQESPEPDPGLVQIGAVSWAEKDLDAAGQYLVSMKPGPLREAMAGGIMEAWVRESPTAAMDWLQLQDWGSDNDMVLSAFSRGVARLDPEGAIAWAQSVQDMKTRRELVISIAESWNAKDPNAVMEWLRSQDLSPQEKSRIVSFSEEDLKFRLGDVPKTRYKSTDGRYRYP